MFTCTKRQVNFFLVITRRRKERTKVIKKEERKKSSYEYFNRFSEIKAGIF